MKKTNLIKNSFVPLTEQIIQIIIHRIISGEYPVNSDMPSQTVLMKEFEVSLITIRNAFKELSKQGIIKTNKGYPTTIKKMPDILNYKYHTMRGFSIDKSQMKIDSLVDNINIDKGTVAIRNILGVNKEDKIVIIKRTRLINQLVIAIETSYINNSLIKNIKWKEELLDGVSLYALLKKKEQIEVQYAEETIEARLANQIEKKIFNFKNDIALLDITRISFQKDKSKPFEYAEYTIIPKYFGTIRYTKISD